MKPKSSSIPRKLQQSLASPDPNDSHCVGIASIDDTKWWVYELSDARALEFGNDSPDIWILTQRFDAIENFRHKVSPDIRDSPFYVMGNDVLEITYGRVG